MSIEDCRDQQISLGYSNKRKISMARAGWPRSSSHGTDLDLFSSTE